MLRLSHSGPATRRFLQWKISVSISNRVLRRLCRSVHKGAWEGHSSTLDVVLQLASFKEESLDVNMDPLSVTAGIVGTISTLQRLVNRIGDDHFLEIITLELTTYTRLLQESAEKALFLESQLPESAADCLRLCRLHQDALSKAFTQSHEQGADGSRKI